MKYFDWNRAKNALLKLERGVSFDDVVIAIQSGGVVDIIEHPNQEKYPNQKIYLVRLNDYIYLVPFVEDDDKKFLKTIVPSRKMTKIYLIDRREKWNTMN